MSWDKYDTMWLLKYLTMAIVWWGSLVCMSFSLMAEYPVAWQYTLITAIVAFIMYSPVEQYQRYKKRPDKILVTLYLMFYGWLGYNAWELTLRMLDYEKTGTLPPILVDPAWTHEWWAFFVYMGGWLCPVIYFSVRIKNRR